MGCGGAEETLSVCERVNAQLRACGEDPVDCQDEPVACRAACLEYLTCEELDEPQDDPGVVACLWHCTSRFECLDGSEIYAAWRCDGEADCAAAEDEAECDD